MNKRMLFSGILFFGVVMSVMIIIVIARSLVFNKEINIRMLYDESIKELPISTLKNLRCLSADEKKKLFVDVAFLEQFDPKKVINNIKAIREPHLILWFTNHFGQIPQKGFEWYQKNIINPLKGTDATFWLVDLEAWRFLSTKEKDLLPCADFVNFRERQTRGMLLTAQECPLVGDCSAMLQTLVSQNPQRFSGLYSCDFFTWMKKLPVSFSQIDKTVAPNLVRTDLRAGAARFSLRELGYCPYFLDYRLIDDNKNLLDIDNTQIFPLLQYLEGIYYALQVIERCAEQGKTECNVLFLLANKEFSYYLVSGETSFFDTFRKNLSWFVGQSACKTDMKVTIYFYPFGYGQDFYDQPYDETGPVLMR